MKIFEDVSSLKDATLRAGQFVETKGYYAPGDGGGGKYLIQSTATVDEYVDHTLTGGTYARLQYEGALNVKQAGAKGDGVTDDTAALLAFKNFLVGSPDGYFPSGTYMLTTSPNWGIDQLQLEFGDNVIFKHIAGSTGYVFECGIDVGHLYGLNFKGQFKVDCCSTSVSPVLMKAVQHSKIAFRVLGSPTNCGEIRFAVCSDFDIVASSNEIPWTTTPASGLILRSRALGEGVTDCTFKVILEAIPSAGLVLREATAGNIFHGTSESNLSGVIDDATCYQNKFDRLWCEGNTRSDMEIAGWGNILHGCHMASLGTLGNVIITTGRNTKIIGGYIRTCDMQSTSRDTMLLGCALSDHPSLGILGAGTYKTVGCVLVDSTGSGITEVVDDVIGSEGVFTPTLVAATPGTTTYIIQEGHYTRVGNIVCASVNISVSSFGGSGAVFIKGLPFYTKSTASAAIGFHHMIALTSRLDLTGVMNSGQNIISLFTCGTSVTGGYIAVDAASVADSASIQLTLTYSAH